MKAKSVTLLPQLYMYKLRHSFMYVHMYMHANVRRDVRDTDLLRVEAQLAGVFVALGQTLVVRQRQLFVQVPTLALQLSTARRQLLHVLHTHTNT